MTELPDPPSLADPITAQILRVAAVHDQLQPWSDGARRASRHLPCYTPAQADALAAELAHLQALERWWQVTLPPIQESLAEHLSALPEVRDAARRLEAGGAREADLFTFKRALYHGALALDAAAEAPGVDAFAAQAEQLRACMAALHPEPAASPRFTLSPSLDAGYGALRKRQRAARRTLRQHQHALEAALRAEYGTLKLLLDGSVMVSGPDMARAAADPRLTARGDGWTFADAEWQALDAEARALDAELEVVEVALRQRLASQLLAELPTIQRALDALTQLDLRLARVRLRDTIGGCWPTLLSDEAPTACAMVGAVHPALRAQQSVTGEPQPISLKHDGRPLALVGPNMGGKSAALSLLGLCWWCAQHALPAPAEAFAFRPVHAIVYVGAEEPGARAAEGLSSFGREIRRVVQARAAALTPSLWLLDELGRGTHPDEGASVALEVIRTLAAEGHLLMLATHFPQLAASEGLSRWRVQGLRADRLDARLAALGADASDAALEGALRDAMDYALTPDDDAQVPRDARRIARLLGWRGDPNP